MFVDEKAIEFFTNEMILVKLDAGEDTAWAGSYHARAYPSSILIRKNGEEVDRLVGFVPTEEYIQTLVDYSRDIGTLDDLLRRAEGREDRSLFLEIADKYKYRGDVGDAENWFARVVDAGEPVDSLSGEARLSQADMFRREKDYDRALEEFGKIAGEFESYHSRDAAIWQAIVHRQKGDTAEAVAAFEAYLEQYPQSEDAEYAQGQIEKLKNPPEVSGE